MGREASCALNHALRFISASVRAPRPRGMSTGDRGSGAALVTLIRAQRLKHVTSPQLASRRQKAALPIRTRVGMAACGPRPRSGPGPRGPSPGTQSSRRGAVRSRSFPLRRGRPPARPPVMAYSMTLARALVSSL
jgi:hypothetical protein